MYLQGEENVNYESVYPDVYYKVQPFAMMAVDELDANSYEMPTRDMVRQISDQIYEDVSRVHPDLAEREYYGGMAYEAAAAYSVPGSQVEAQRFFRRGGFFNDLIDIILLNEFFRRRRRF